MTLLKTCENRLCGNQFEPHVTTYNQPSEKQQRFCCKDCRNQSYQLGRYRIETGCRVEVSWPLLTTAEKNIMFRALQAAQGYGTVESVVQSKAKVKVHDTIYTLHVRKLVRLS